MKGLAAHSNKLIFLRGNEHFWSNVIPLNLSEETSRSVKVENWKTQIKLTDFPLPAVTTGEVRG